jgi:Condensation domain/AMP-binding enzyme
VGLALSPKQIFERPTVAELAAALEASGAEQRVQASAAVESQPFSLSELDDAQRARLLSGPERVEDVYPLSPMQEGMLFHGLTLPGSGLYVSQLGCVIEGPLDVAAFRRAWAETMERHPVLRTAFRWADVPRPLQVVVSGLDVPLQLEDWSHLSPAEQAVRLDALLAEDRRRGFELERGPLFRLALLRLAPERHRFLLSNHHAILDGWSLPLLLREVFARYEGQDPGPSGPPFREYIASLARRDAAGSEGFWRRALSGVEVPTPLGIDGTGTRGRSAEVPSETRRLAPPQVARLQEVARELGVTLNTLVQAAWSVVLSRYSGQEDVVFGVTVSGRPPELPGVESMVGLFINTLPLRVAVPRKARVREWLKDIQARQVELAAHDQTPLANIQRWCGLSGGASLFESLLVFENYPLDSALSQGLSRLRFSDIDGAHRTHYPLVLIAMPGDGLTLTFSFDEARVHPSLVQGALGHLERVLSGIAEGLDGHVGDLALLSREEAHALVASGRRDWVRPAAEERIHARFEAQADARPDAVAVRAADASLTYAELERRANQLAHRLLREGMGPDVPVALCVERSLELVVGVLGILKAGGAYVPLDLSYPPERVAFMLEDAGARVVVTGGVERLPDLGGRPVVSLDDGALGAEPSHRPESPVTGGNVA